MLEKIIMVVLIGIIFFVIADIVLYIMLKIKQFKIRKDKQSDSVPPIFPNNEKNKASTREDIS